MLCDERIQVNENMKQKIDILIVNSNELLTLAGSNKPKFGKERSELGVIKNGAVAVKDGNIIDVGKTESLKKKFSAEEIIDAKNKVVMPGFVDCHTHTIFAGSREDEFVLKLQGISYMEILKKGGGILKTVRETRKANKKSLFYMTKKRLDKMLKNGTTTVEIKSGYGLTTKDEIKLLEVIKELNEKHKIDIVTTFLGAHAIPLDITSDNYTKLVTNEMLPLVAKRKLAEFCDVFCEKDVFSVEQSRMILNKAKELGLKLKIHADEIIRTGGAELAAEVKATSAEHLLKSSYDGIKSMFRSNVIAVLLPATSFFLNAGYANSKQMMEENVPIALATDFNPGCLCYSMQTIISLACTQMKMLPSEAIVASTINAAHAVSRANEAGSIEVGKKADIIIMDVHDYNLIPQHIGDGILESVIKGGKIIF